jgi:DNA-binding response OmpR family regulator
MNIPSIEKILESMTILYIESDIKFNHKVTEALKIKSKKVFSATSVEDAIELYKTAKPDIIITEVILNKSSGLDFINNLRKVNSTIPIIVISSSTKVEHLLKSIRLNLIDYILKPINIKQLRTALQRSVSSLFQNALVEIEFLNGTKYNYQKKLLMDQDDNDIKITHNEIELLNILLVNQHYILSMDEIKDLVWEDNYYVTDQAFKSLLNRLRKKIGKESIKNISGSGYILNLTDE